MTGIGIAVNAQGRRKRPQGQRTTPAPVVDPDSSIGVSDVCPEPNGFFADAYQCDKYYQCTDGKVKEKLCPGTSSIYCVLWADLFEHVANSMLAIDRWACFRG